MQKSDIRILIIEDDRSLGRALEEGLKRAGFSTQLVNSYTQAKNATNLNEFHGYIVDCMLPQKSGVETILELTHKSHGEPVIVLTSGVYKDRAYVNDAISKTKAKSFLTKPFNIEELILFFEDQFASLIDQKKDPLFRLLSQEQYSARDKITALTETEFSHGFDLPLIYTMLMDQQIFGELQIEYDDLPKSTVGFSGGRIDKVLHHDTESYFGVLLIEKGFTTPEALEQGLRLADNKPIGQRLVEMSNLSPHAIEIIQLEQMIIRLSKTIRDTSVRLKFVELEKNPPAVYVDEFQFSQLLNDWINSKITTEWLRSFYTGWMDYPVMRGPAFKKAELLKQLPVLKPLEHILSEGNWPHRLQDLLQQSPQLEDEILRGVHFLISQRCLVFGESTGLIEDFSAKRNRLEKIWENMHDKNHFEVLGLNKKARPSEVHRAYQEMAKSLHPDKLPPTAPSDIRELTQKIFSRIADAHQNLSSDEKRAHYLKTIEVGHAEEILKAESQFEESFRMLQSNRFREARKSFEQTQKMKGHRSDTIVYVIWALIKEKRHKVNRAELAQHVSHMLNKVAHEDRHSPQYFFTKGMYYELSGQVQKAYNHFKHCLAIEPGFQDARREISYIKQNYNSKTNTLTDDLSQVVTKLFRKRSG